jgi:hypothetical protein
MDPECGREREWVPEVDADPFDEDVVEAPVELSLSGGTESVRRRRLSLLFVYGSTVCARIDLDVALRSDEDVDEMKAKVEVKVEDRAEVEVLPAEARSRFDANPGECDFCAVCGGGLLVATDSDSESRAGACSSDSDSVGVTGPR